MIDRIPLNFIKQGFDWVSGKFTRGWVNGEMRDVYVATYPAGEWWQRLLNHVMVMLGLASYSHQDTLAWYEVYSAKRSKGSTVRTVWYCDLHYYTEVGWVKKTFTVTQEELTPAQTEHMKRTARAWWLCYVHNKGEKPSSELFHDWKHKVFTDPHGTFLPYEW